MKKVAINGFGRIGRLTLRQLILSPDIDVVAINDLTDVKTLATLFKYDSMQGKYQGKVSYSENYLEVDDQKIQIFSQRDPVNLPWADLDIDVVLECTGFFRTKEGASKHLKAGAKKVILSAPPKSPGIPTIVMGVNDQRAGSTSRIISNASCTTNCIAPILDHVHKLCHVDYAVLSTVHAYTGNQRLQDAPHKDLRRGRAAALNIIPTTTGAASALALVIPELEGKLNASAIRVPVATGSLVELLIYLKEETTREVINTHFKALAEGELKGVLEYTEDPIVSADIVGNTHSSILDASLTTMIHARLLKVTAWYDNEAGYSARMASLVLL